MHGFTLLSVVLCTLTTLAAAESHSHRSNHRGIHRRHHARAQDADAPVVNRPKRRACPVKPSGTNSTVSASPSSTAPASSSVLSSVVPSSTDTSSSVVPTSTSVDNDDDERHATSSMASSSHAASSTSSSAKPAATSSSEKLSTTSSLLAALFPVSNAVTSWSTAQSSNSRSTALTLSDETLRTTRVLSGTTHKYMDWQGKTAMQAHYPKGSYNFQHSPRGGFSWYGYGPAAVDLTTAREVTLAYSVWFESGFDFVLGGKLPGLWGGNSDEGSISCSGGARSNDCFSSRFMWRTPTNGVAAGELYTYLPPSFKENEKLCTVPPYSDCNPVYGASVGRGAYQIPTGKWVTLAQRVRLNDVNEANGQIQVFVDGKSVISVSGLVLRNSDAGKIRGVFGQTFFGGSKPEWASTKDQNAYFADFSVAITEKF